ncbi:ABC transporter permease [Herbidospora mongoliensis]|uniref:ABC transporter permease n=1 Tax=Herbidospora mongoliensis TaxID=688067 RepID=UPI00082AAD7A|nr:ABC transporter permease [Herbidospora mongoliensis]
MIDAIRSEWAKTWSTRSTWFTVALIVALGGLFALLFGFAAAAEHARDPAAFGPEPDFRPLIFVQVAVGYLGLRMFTIEHLTQTMALTLTTVPRRGRVLAAKAVVCFGVTLAVGTVTGLVVVFVNRAVLTSQNMPVTALTDPGMLRVLAGPGLLLALLGLIGLAVGALVRSTAGALIITIVIGVFVPAMASLYPEWLARLILSYLPITAGLRLLSLDGDPDLPGPWAGIAVTCAWAAVLLVTAYAVFRRRDA